MNISKNLRQHFSFIILFIILLIVGFSIYSDYGISWDEPACRNDMAIPNYKFILDGDYNSLKDNIAKYHGPAFELLLFQIEKLFEIKDIRDIFLMRHLVTFLLFAFSIIFFYKLCLRIFKSNNIATLGAAMLILSPRVFAESFYNVKDLAFLSIMCISLYTTVRFLDKKNFSTALLHAFVSAIAIDIRIMGIIIPVFTFFFLIWEIIRIKERREKLIKVSVLFLIVLIVFVILFWPILWRNPVENFINAFRESSKYPWGGTLLYCGKLIDASGLPWHYIPVWLLVTTPLLYTLLFLAGLVSFVQKLYSKRVFSVIDLLNVYVFFVPVFSVITLHSVLYDGWRHLYYIYPSFIIIALSGFHFLFVSEKSEKIKRVLFSGIVLYCIYIAFVMFKLHPYQNLYFNYFAGKSLAEARENFEMDYWGLSYKEGISNILETDTSKNIKIYSSEYDPLINNLQFVQADQRYRIASVYSIVIADYYLTCYRSIRKLCKDCPGAYHVIRDSGIILSVYNVKKDQIDFAKVGHVYASFENNYESPLTNWTRAKTTIDSSSSTPVVENVDSSTVFGSNLFFSPSLGKWNSKIESIYMKVSLKVKSKKPYEGSIVFQADSGDGKTYEWNQYYFGSSDINQWNTHEIITLLPDAHSGSDNFKVYFCNIKRVNVLLDDFKVNFFSIPDSLKKSFLSKINK